MDERETGRRADRDRGRHADRYRKRKKNMEDRGEDKMGRQKETEEVRLGGGGALTCAFVGAQRVLCRASVFMEQPAAPQGSLGHRGPNSLVTISPRAGRS